MDLQHSAFISALIMGIVPYCTQGIRWILEQIISKVPFWAKPLLPIVMGSIASGITKATGVELPLGLSHISNDQVTQIISSGYILGAIGAHLNDFVGGLKKSYPPTSIQGKILNALFGAHTASQMVPHDLTK